MRAAWIRAVQSDADPRYDFVLRSTDGPAEAMVHGTRFAVDADGIEISRPDGWWSEVQLRRVGRASAMRSVPNGAAHVSRNEYTVERGVVGEQWVSGPLGVEQIVSLAERPQGAGDLLVELLVEGDLEAVQAADGNIDLRDAAGTTRARYSDVFVEDADGERVPASFEVAGTSIRLRIDDSDASYPLVIDPLVGVEEAHLFASDATAADHFGSAVAFDGTTAVVGAPNDDTAGGVDAGSVYVFVRNAGVWTQQAHLFASDGVANDQFGGSVALSGNTIVVGSARDDVGANADAGSAYVFLRTGTTWAEQAHLFASDGSAFDRFAKSVAIDTNTIVVGAYFDDTTLANAGSAYVYTRAGTTWTQATHIVAADPAINDLYGSSVSISGTSIVVGALGHASAAGALYVYTGSGTTWTLQQELSASDGAAGDTLGGSVSIDGNTVVSGATEHNGARGGVYVYTRSGTTWAETQRLTSSTVIAGDRVGASVALDGANLIVGATSSGALGYATIFRNAATWSEVGHVVAADQAIDDNFGLGVDMSADTAFIGASFDDTAAGVDAGSAYVELLRSANGDTCTTGAACASGNCIDGVCCNTTCGNGVVDCQACSVAAGGAVNGTCNTFAASAVCRPAVAGGCDVAEVCSGGTTCPPDVVIVAGTTCRAAMGACDVTDTCDGTSPTCVDNRVPAGTVCRVSTGSAICDPAESCVASNPACPADTNTNGVSCTDNVACNGAEVCAAGACASATPPNCNDTDACTVDMCTEPTGCGHVRIVDCCNTDADCNDGDGCTADMCSGAGGTCSHTHLAVCVDSGPLPIDAAMPGDGSILDSGARDAGRDAGRDSGVHTDGGDAGDVDSGTVTPPASNCGCAAAGMGQGTLAAPFGLLGLALVAARRRRR